MIPVLAIAPSPESTTPQTPSRRSRCPVPVPFAGGPTSMMPENDVSVRSKSVSLSDPAVSGDDSSITVPTYCVTV
jgi:hypothetical protein